VPPSTLQQKKYFAHPQALVESEEIGADTRIWAYAHVMQGVSIGKGCNIGDHAFIESGVHLGNNVTVKNGVSIWQGVEIEDRVFLGPNCVFTNDLNPRAFIRKSPEQFLSTRVRTGASIGANATIVCGVTIGRYALVGAGAVVVRDIPDFALVVGNPARQIGWICVCATRLPSTSADLLTCSSCSRSFQKRPESVITEITEERS
jgi:UDP-2-acetamido-3-amino-2,3-dideoxy-glucuronate N-acetyltransferase